MDGLMRNGRTVEKLYVNSVISRTMSVHTKFLQNETRFSFKKTSRFQKHII